MGLHESIATTTTRRRAQCADWYMLRGKGTKKDYHLPFHHTVHYSRSLQDRFAHYLVLTGTNSLPRQYTRCFCFTPLLFGRPSRKLFDSLAAHFVCVRTESTFETLYGFNLSHRFKQNHGDPLIRCLSAQNASSKRCSDQASVSAK